MPNAHTRTSIIKLSNAGRAERASMARSRSLPAALTLRARIVLACEGPQTASTDVAQALGITRDTVGKWRGRYARARIAGLYEELRPGRPRTVDEERVAELINKTLHTKPADGGTHWSVRGLAAETGISKSSVNRCLQTFKIKPHRTESFKLSDDPFFVDEKSQCQALERTQPMLPMGPGYVEGVTHDYVRHGTTTLFAALNVLTGEVMAQCKARHRHQEFLNFAAHHRQGRSHPSGCTLHRGQLRRPQAPEGAGLAGAATALAHALRADLLQLAESGGAILLHHYCTSHPPWLLPQRQRTHCHDHPVRRTLQQELPAVRLDRHCRLHP